MATEQVSTPTVSSNAKSSSKKKGTDFTPKGTMPPCKCARFKTSNVGTWNQFQSKVIHSREKRKWVKTQIQDIKLLRMLTLKAPYQKLPVNIKNAVQFFSDSFTSLPPRLVGTLPVVRPVSW